MVFRSALATVALAGGVVFGSCHQTCPLPDEFDAAFSKGTVCMPSTAHTSGSSAKPPQFPMRFDFCLLRCVSIVPLSESLTYAWHCPGGQCEMVMLATARLSKAPGTSCDGCKLEDPPASECEQRSVTFQVDPPAEISASGEKNYLARTFTVRIAYVTLEQAARIQNDIRSGVDPVQAIMANGGGGRHPGRAFTVSFDPNAPPVSDGNALGGADCHPIALP
jgi:hypothetical protein